MSKSRKQTEATAKSLVLGYSSLSRLGMAGSLVAGVAALSLNSPVVAQPSAATRTPGDQTAAPPVVASDEAGQKLQEVVVTARKRGESLLSVPIAISAVTAKDIQAVNITTLQDVVTYTPSFTINNNASDHPDRAIQNIYIRGMSSGPTPPVSVFIDGSPVPTGFLGSVADASRVEILKGPQSAFFGRDTFGGAINVVTKDPSSQAGGGVDVLGGNDGWYDLKGSVEGPIVPDVLSARLFVSGFHTDGQFRSTVPPDARLGQQSTKTVALSLRFTPISNLTIKTFLAVSQDKDGPAPVAKFGAASYNCNAGAAPAGTNNFICGTLPNITSTYLPVQTAVDQLFTNQVFGNNSGTLNPLFKDLIYGAGFERNSFHGNLNIDYTIPRTNIVISSITSGNYQESEDIVDLDNQDTRGIFNFYTLFGIPNVEQFYQWFARVQARNEDFNQELRLSTDQTKRLRFTFGANYEDSRTQSYVDGLFPFGVASFGGGGPQIDEVYGVFGSASFDVTSKLNIDFDARYQVDRVQVDNRAIGVADSFTAATTTKNFLPRAIVQYKFIPDAMVYATYSKGVNPPVFNTALVGNPAQILAEFQSIYGVGIVVKPEYLENYEVGVKGRFFDGRLQLAADGYFDYWRNQILSQFVSVPGVPGYLGGADDAETVQTNGGLTHLYGAEVDGQLEVTRNLVFSFAGAYNKSDIRTYPGYHCPGDACTPNGGTTDITGHNLPNAPIYAANVAATYTGRLNDRLGWYGRADYIYKGSQYTDLSNLTKIGASNRFNFRLGVTQGTLSIEGFVLNAFNDKAYASVNGTTDIDGQPNQYGAYPLAEVLGVPVLRQYGVRLRKTF